MELCGFCKSCETLFLISLFGLMKPLLNLCYCQLTQMCSGPSRIHAYQNRQLIYHGCQYGAVRLAQDWQGYFSLKHLSQVPPTYQCCRTTLCLLSTICFCRKTATSNKTAYCFITSDMRNVLSVHFPEGWGRGKEQHSIQPDHLI